MHTPSPALFSPLYGREESAVPVTFPQGGETFDYMEWLATNPVVGGITAATPVGPACVVFDSGVPTTIIICRPREPESGVTRSGSAACNNCAPHAYEGRCARMRDGTPYPTAPARAASAASSHPSMPSLISVSSESVGVEAVLDKVQEASREQVATSLTALDVAGNGHTRLIFGPHAGRAATVDLLHAVQIRFQRDNPRRCYDAWTEFGRIQDVAGVLASTESFMRQVLMSEPFYHPDQEAPAGQVLFDYLHDAEIAADMLRTVMRSSEARRLLSPFRRSITSSRRRVSSLYEEGLYIDEDAGVLARDIAEPGRQLVTGLIADELTGPIGNAIQVLSAVNGLVHSHAERRKRHF